LSFLQSNIDDYIQYAPIGIIYASNLFKIKEQHNIWNQTKILAVSQLISGAICHSLKMAINAQRPNGQNYSFPSGHTSQSFVSATVLYKKYMQTNKLVAYSGYVFSSLTGIYRMINNKHWISDVFVGAGLGILVTNFVYKYKSLFIKKDKKSKIEFQIVPQIYVNNISLNLKLSF
jgi:membrane-associated phospholipid phosphatase